MRSLSRSRSFFAVQAVALAMLLIAGSDYAVERYRIGISAQIRGCLPDTRALLIDRRDHELVRGGIYAFLALGSGPWMPDDTQVAKILAALPGDRVSVTHEGVWVNGDLRAEGLALAKTLGQPATDFERDFIVPHGEALMLGASVDSYDGRYWGTIPLTRIVGRAHRLF